MHPDQENDEHPGRSGSGQHWSGRRAGVWRLRTQGCRIIPAKYTDQRDYRHSRGDTQLQIEPKNQKKKEYIKKNIQTKKKKIGMERHDALSLKMKLIHC